MNKNTVRFTLEAVQFDKYYCNSMVTLRSLPSFLYLCGCAVANKAPCAC